MTRLTRLGLLVAIAGGLLAVAPPLADPYVLAKWLALAAGGAFIWAGLFKARLQTTVLDRPLAALWLVMILSAVYSADPPASVFGMYPQAFYGLLPLFLCTALYYAAAQLAGEPSQDDMLRWMLAASVPLTAYGISQRFLGDFLVSAPIQNNRISSTIGAPVMLGGCLVLLTPLALHWALTKNNNLGRACAALIAAALVMTWARGAWGSAALAGAAYLWLTGRLRLGRRRLLAAALAAPLVFFVLQRGLKKVDSDLIRVESMKSSLSRDRGAPAARLRAGHVRDPVADLPHRRDDPRDARILHDPDQRPRRRSASRRHAGLARAGGLRMAALGPRSAAVRPLVEDRIQSPRRGRRRGAARAVRSGQVQSYPAVGDDPRRASWPAAPPEEAGRGRRPPAAARRSWRRRPAPRPS